MLVVLVFEQEHIASEIVDKNIQTVHCFHLFLMIQCNKKFADVWKTFVIVVMCAEGNILLAGGLIYILDQIELVVE